MSAPRDVSSPWCAVKRDRSGFVVEAVVVLYPGQIIEMFDECSSRIYADATLPNGTLGRSPR